MRTLFSCLILSLSFSLSAQFQGVVFNGDYAFNEGIFLSHESWVANTPDLNWEDIKGEMVQLPEDYRIQLAGFRHKDGRVVADIYAVSLDGFPYLFTRHNKEQDFHEFAGLRFRGRYAYYRFEDKETVTTTMYAYNPANGRPFREAPVTRDRLVAHEVLLHVQSGETTPLTQANVYELLNEHPDLQRAVGLLASNDPELKTKLLQAIKLFNEREPLLLRHAE